MNKKNSLKKRTDNTTIDLISHAIKDSHSLKDKIEKFKSTIEDPLKRYESIMIVLQSILVDLVEKYDDGFFVAKKDGSNPYIKHIVDLSKEIRMTLDDARKDIIKFKFVGAIKNTLQETINIVEECAEPGVAKDIVKRIQSIHLKITDNLKVEKL